MQIKILKDDKNQIDIEIDSLTIVELLRIYCNKEGAKIAAWRRDHPTKNPVLHVEGENASKIVQKAIVPRRFLLHLMSYIFLWTV